MRTPRYLINGLRRLGTGGKNHLGHLALLACALACLVDPGLNLGCLTCDLDAGSADITDDPPHLLGKPVICLSQFAEFVVRERLHVA